MIMPLPLAVVGFAVLTLAWAATLYAVLAAEFSPWLLLTMLALTGGFVQRAFWPPPRRVQRLPRH